MAFGLTFIHKRLGLSQPACISTAQHVYVHATAPCVSVCDNYHLLNVHLSACNICIKIITGISMTVNVFFRCVRDFWLQKFLLGPFLQAALLYLSFADMYVSVCVCFKLIYNNSFSYIFAIQKPRVWVLCLSTFMLTFENCHLRGQIFRSAFREIGKMARGF